MGLLSYYHFSAATAVVFSCRSLAFCVFGFSVAAGPAARAAASKNIARMNSNKMAEAAGDATIDTNYSAEKNKNMAQYLVDLHDSQATFDFCGGMMFQLVLSDALREHLSHVSNNDDDGQQPVVCRASKSRMHHLDGYGQSAEADNRILFHGREIRNVKNAAGGMGMVLHLSWANNDDPEGWTTQEIQNYNGWTHDVHRDWRTGDRFVQEGFEAFPTKFGPQAYSLHHRFYLHVDRSNRLWLSAEDGCEGTPAGSATSVWSSLARKLGL